MAHTICVRHKGMQNSEQPTTYCQSHIRIRRRNLVSAKQKNNIVNLNFSGLAVTMVSNFKICFVVILNV